jgi:hypothetical protein
MRQSPASMLGERILPDTRDLGASSGSTPTSFLIKLIIVAYNLSQLEGSAPLPKQSILTVLHIYIEYNYNWTIFIYFTYFTLFL